MGSAALADAVRARLRADPKAFAAVDALDAGARRARARRPSSTPPPIGPPSSRARSTPSPRSCPTRAAGPTIRLLYDEARDESRQAHDRVGGTLGGALPAGCGPLFALEDASVAPRARVGGYVLSKLLPLVVVVMIMLGAFYPAIDITAGERERGTLETILSAPVSRFDLMTGKVIAVAVLSAVTGLLNMTSMSLTMIQGIHLVGATAPVTIPWTRAASTLIVVLPASFLFAAVMVAIGAMARSFKEAQTLLTPVYFLCFTPSLIAGLGDWELGGMMALVPGVNVTLLARDLILGKATFGVTLTVVASTLAFGGLALTLAARLYDSERLLAADEGKLALGAWVRRLVGWGGAARAEGEATTSAPSPGQALAVFALAFVLMVGVFVPLQRWRLATGVAISEWIGMLGLVVLYARGTGQRILDVLRVRRVPARALAGAVLMGLSAWVVLATLAQWIAPPPRELEESLRRFVVPTDGSRGLVLSLALIALTPAICEEALFRGPILRGFAGGLPRLTSAVLTGVLFGLFHLDLWRLLPTAMLGIGLSLVALETGSIVPAMLMHFVNNATLVTLATSGPPARRAASSNWAPSSACSAAASSSSFSAPRSCAAPAPKPPLCSALHELLLSGARGADKTHSVGEPAMTNGEDKRAIALLRKCDVLSDISLEALQVLAPNIKLGTYRPRQVIYLPGDRAQGVHFLTTGRIKISKVTRDGKELTLAYRTEGDFFGEPCLLEGGPREEMAEAMDASMTVEVDRELLDQLLRTNGTAAYKFAKALISRRKDLETRVEQLIFKDVGSKLAELLLSLGAEHGIADERGLIVGLKITHQEMANLIGSTRETVSLTLSQFKRKGLIQTEGRKVILADPEGLKALA